MERLDQFMARANAAYYANHDPFADFTTAPEISQVFGELIGAWAAVAWLAMGQPDTVVLAELGPGRGTLIGDALRAIRATLPDFARALRLHLVETSPRLRALQAGRLQALDQAASWHDDLATVPEAPLILIGNEFLDALPIRQFRLGPQGWTERHIADGAWQEVAIPAPETPLPLSGLAEGAVIERCEPALALARALGGRVSRHPGMALFLDYGPLASAPGDSLQALRNGRPADPLAAPGCTDLTAHVDFCAFAAAAEQAGATAYGPLAQGKFLTRLGLFQRTDRLARGRTPRAALALIDTAQRLAEPTRMGGLFKALALTHPALPVPAGFESP